MRAIRLFVMTAFVALFPSILYAADTNTTVSSTVVDKAPPTASAPSIVINNSDVCKSAASAAKLARSMYGMGMKVAAVSMLCQDAHAFDAMWMAGTPCPYKGAIGDDAKKAWEENPEDAPADSKMFKKKESQG